MVSKHKHNQITAMNPKTLKLFTVVLLLLSYSGLAPTMSMANTNTSLPVFPGAEGFGTQTVGGRYGNICRVTTNDDSGGGSLRDCLNNKDPKIIVFTIGGVIELKSSLIIDSPFVSIFGQTAPGDGIMIRGTRTFNGPLLQIASHDILIQHLRLRAGASDDPSCCRDALSIANKVPKQVYNVVVDHSSLSWGTDEVADIWYDSNNITISHSIISEGLNNSTNTEGPAGRGFIIGSEGSHSISFHHNFLAHNYQRNPLVKSPGVTDVVSNLVYHWVSRAAGIQAEYGDTRVNFVNNKFIAKSSSNSRQRSDKRWSDISVEDFGNDLSIYLEDNEGYKLWFIFQDQSRLLGIGKKNYKKKYNYISEKRHPAPKISETLAEDLEEELVKNVGATLPKQDATDLRLFEELRNRNGKMPDCVAVDDPPSIEICASNNVGGWPTYDQGEPILDSDKDGLPDEWENLNNLDSNDSSDSMSFHPSGYTHLETWVHSLNQR